MNRKHLFLAVFIIGLLSVQVFAQMQNYVQLYRYLVDLPGWKASEPTGMNMSGPMGQMVTASREYESENRTLTAQIVSGTQAQGAWARFSTGMTFDTPQAFSKVTEMRGHQVGINHDKNENSGNIVVYLKSKVFAVFVLAYEGMPYKDAMVIAQKFPWKFMEEAFR